MHRNTFWPIEIKWGRQLRPNDLKQIQKYKQGKIFARVDDIGIINHTPVIPLPLGLLDLF